MVFTNMQHLSDHLFPNEPGKKGLSLQPHINTGRLINGVIFFVAMRHGLPFASEKNRINRVLTACNMRLVGCFGHLGQAL